MIGGSTISRKVEVGILVKTRSGVVGSRGPSVYTKMSRALKY